MNYPKVSIIILNWNGLKDTEECLASLKKITYPNFEVIVVDNGSRKGDCRRLQKKWGRFALVSCLPQNFGFAEGCNRAFQKANGKYALFLNNDTVTEQGFLEPLVEAMEADERIGAVQSKSRYYYKREYFDYAGAGGGMIDILGYPFARGRLFYTNEVDEGQYNQTASIFWASGVALMAKAKAIKRLGLFDPLYFNYFEEIDFCWRLWCNNYKIVFIPNSVIYHKVAASAKRNLVKKFYLEHRNNIIFIIKNYHWQDLALLLPLRILLDAVALFYYLFTQRKARFWGLVRAYFWLLAHLPLLARKRRELKKRLRLKDLPVYKKSIILEYFVRGKRRYSDL